MPVPLTLTFRRLVQSKVLVEQVRSRFDKLGRFSSSVIAGRVLVERNERHNPDGDRYHVRILLALPGEDVVIEHKASVRPSARTQGAAQMTKQAELDRDLRHAGIAIHKAFDAARRRLQDRVRRRRDRLRVSS